MVHVEPDIRSGLDKYRVAGRDSDGRRLEVVANLDQTGPGRVIVITAIDASNAVVAVAGRTERKGEPGNRG